jgi:hypothetical protein
MLWAEQPQVGTALAGVPMEQRYVQYAMENPAPVLEDVPDMSADDTVADASTETQPDDTTAAAAPKDDNSATDKTLASAPPKALKPKRKVAPQPTEEDVAIVRPRESDDPVVNVLKDMFSIFNSDDSSKAKRKRKDTVLVLPDANTKKKRKSNVKFMRLKPREN